MFTEFINAIHNNIYSCFIVFIFIHCLKIINKILENNLICSNFSILILNKVSNIWGLIY